MDVIPSPGQRWLAVCSECGARHETERQEAAWAWLLDHPCTVDA